MKSKHAMSSKQASLVKRRGHQREEVFNSHFGGKGFVVNYSGASPDNTISKENSICKELIKKGLIKKSKDIPVSLKSGNTIQIHLGNLPELTNKDQLLVSKLTNGSTKVEHGISFDEQLDILRDPIFWNRYLKKGDLLCYDDKEGTYCFFNMDDVINFICKECEWRILPTGRLKGNFCLRGKDRQFLTYEYRRKKKQFVLGAHGGKKGKEFIDLLREKVKHLIKKV